MSKNQPIYQKLYQTLTALPSPDDYHDKIYEYSSEKTINIKLPQTINYIPDLLPIQNQQSTHLCLALAGACIKEWQEKKDINLDEHMSAQFIYNLRTSGHQGMTGRDLLNILKQKGCLPDRLFPKDGNVSDYLTRAKQFRIESYARILSIIGLKRALFENGPALLLMPVFDITQTEFWKPTKPFQLRQGGQALVVVGYDKKGFWLRNSWGSDYGKNGYVLYPYSDWGYHWECWTLIDLKTSLVGIDLNLNFEFNKIKTQNTSELKTINTINTINNNNDYFIEITSINEEQLEDGDCPTCNEKQSDEKQSSDEQQLNDTIDRPKKVSFKNPVFR